jgi:hypothetical protein
MFYFPLQFQELPPLVVSEISYETETKTVVQTQTITVPAPANTRRAEFPTPEAVSSPSTTDIPRTTAVDIITDEDDDSPSEGPKTVTVVRGPRPTRRPARWFGGW